MFFNNRHSFMIGLIFGLTLASLIFMYGFLSTERPEPATFSAPYGSYYDDGEDLYEFEVAPKESDLRFEV